MILTGTAIANACAIGELMRITPMDYSHLKPNSYEITLGDTVHFYNLNNDRHQDTLYGQVDANVDPDRFGHLAALQYDDPNTTMIYKRPVIDTADLPELVGLPMPETGFLLFPGNIYLVDTVEEISLYKVVSEFAGKAELASMGIEVNSTARYGNLGDTFHYCAQIKVTYPTMIYPGMVIGQVVFHTIEGAVGSQYTGRYSRRENGVKENGYRPEPALRDRVRQMREEMKKKQEEAGIVNDTLEHAETGANPITESEESTMEENEAVVAPPVNTDVPEATPVDEVVMDINEVLGSTGGKVMVDKNQVK